MKEKNIEVMCPYKQLPDTSYWRKSVAGIAPGEIDPVISPRFVISKEEKISTAGSCFAQHIARYVKQSGFNYFVSEPGHPVLGEEVLKKYNYGTFSARYGNIYTVKQLVQLFERAYGLRQPEDDLWEEEGRFVDPFRPYIQPESFLTKEEFYSDRAVHLGAVKRIVEESDVFIFTLGLTEAWKNSKDGTVYALCPGCGAGRHNPAVHEFYNFEVMEVIDDLSVAIGFLKERNPSIKILLTVSPVPLVATFEKQHVLTATTYSKSVLRVAAQSALQKFENVDYFPSYEIITSNFSRGHYYADNLRDVEEVGVAHAMHCFFRNYLKVDIPENMSASLSKNNLKSGPLATNVSERINEVICDEERLGDM